MEACSYLGVHIVLKRCEVIAFYGFTVLLRGIMFILCCIMIKVEVEGCILVLKGGGREAYGRAYSSLFYDVRTHGVQ